jgi:hypothetical protein
LSQQYLGLSNFYECQLFRILLCISFFPYCLSFTVNSRLGKLLSFEEDQSQYRGYDEVQSYYG